MKSAEAVKKLRISIAYTQTELAKELGVQKGTISGWEVCRRVPRLPKIRQMLELAKKHKVKMTVEDFLN